MVREITDVVIVGGGIVGMTTAYLLGKRGIKSVVIEKDSIGSHASGFAYGGLGADRTMGPMALVAQEGWRLHNEFAGNLFEETGIDIQFRVRPSLTLSFTEDESINLKNGFFPEKIYFSLFDTSLLKKTYSGFQTATNIDRS